MVTAFNNSTKYPGNARSILPLSLI